MASEKRIADIETAASFLTLMGNEKRLEILSHLLDDELSVGTIAERIALSQSALSQHLAKLRSFGLVETRRDRQMIYYSCRSEAVRELLDMLADRFDATAKAEPRHYLHPTGT
ncbi:MAG: winged helix-turn-helix transcriptional regulator [Mesorhizobium sp.]|nr:metalloregulator ArsR/SmtB family transcription factor [Mesorhizobium sp.]MBN9243494.1 winged helix-turn-helix transcriptional regulator [Mesorhizobium sp.]